MRKVMLLAAMLAMVLVAAAPAFAQTAVDDSVAVDNSTSTEYNAVCQNVIGSIETGDAGQYGDATATDDSVAAVAAELDTSVDVVNECLNAEGVTVVAGGGGAAAASASAAAGSAAAGSAAAASSGGVLPDTGGASLITLGAGALLVAGGLLARRIVR